MNLLLRFSVFFLVFCKVFHAMDRDDSRQNFGFFFNIQNSATEEQLIAQTQLKEAKLLWLQAYNTAVKLKSYDNVISPVKKKSLKKFTHDIPTTENPAKLTEFPSDKKIFDEKASKLFKKILDAHPDNLKKEKLQEILEDTGYRCALLIESQLETGKEVSKDGCEYLILMEIPRCITAIQSICIDQANPNQISRNIEITEKFSKICQVKRRLVEQQALKKTTSLPKEINTSSPSSSIPVCNSAPVDTARNQIPSPEQEVPSSFNQSENARRLSWVEALAEISQSENKSATLEKSSARAQNRESADSRELPRQQQSNRLSRIWARAWGKLKNIKSKSP